MEILVAARVIAASLVLALAMSGCDSQRAGASPSGSDERPDPTVWIRPNDPERAAIAERVKKRLPEVAAAVKKLSLGDQVEVKVSEVADYVWWTADGGRREGGESMDLHQRERGAR